MMQDVLRRYESYGWHTTAITGVNDTRALYAAIELAKAVTDKPSIIKMKTIIGFGSKKQGLEEVHGAPLGMDDLKHVKTLFGFDPEETFVIPDDVAEHWLEKKAQGAAKEQAWSLIFDAYKAAYPDLGSEYDRRIRRELPPGYKEAVPRYTPEPKGNGTRKFSQAALAAIAPVVPELVGGSADLTGSNCTVMACTHDFQKGTPDGRYIRFGVREHGMSAVCNGLFAHGMIRFAFSYYLVAPPTCASVTDRLAQHSRTSLVTLWVLFVCLLCPASG
jgi:transketolase